MPKKSKATKAEPAVAVGKKERVLKDPEVKALEKAVYTSGYWDAVRGVRALFGAKCEHVGIYDKGFAAGKKALESGKVAWSPKRAPKQRVGYEPTAATIAAQAAQVAIDGVVADPEAQARVSAEVDGDDHNWESATAPLTAEEVAAGVDATEVDPGDDEDENGDEQDDAVAETDTVEATDPVLVEASAV